MNDVVWMCTHWNTQSTLMMIELTQSAPNVIVDMVLTAIKCPEIKVKTIGTFFSIC